MTNSKMTKRALLTSLMALVLCFAMLTGTTFAWFTDQETSGNNKIIAGNLDIEMYAGDSTTPIETGTPLFEEVKLWEPGAVAYENITVKNEGNLALKYQLSVNFADGGLAEALKVGVVEDGVTKTERADVIAEVKSWIPMESFVEEGQLVNNGDSKIYGIVIYWEPSDDDNKFNGNDKNSTKEFSVEFGINLFATQLVAEFDSFGDDYDANAPITDADAWDGSASGDLNTKEDATAKTLTISSAADLAAFRDAVNTSNKYSGWTVILATDIDLQNKAWTPIGVGNVFSGIFDGAGHTVYNLNVDVASHAGLFGIASYATIKNVNVVNATLKSNHFAGAVLAQGYANVMDCTVDNATVVCVPELIGDKYDNGDKAGILVGWMADYTISGNTVKNSSITGYRDIGGIAGYADDENGDAYVLNNTAENCVITLNDTNAYSSASKNASAIVGRNGIADAEAYTGNVETNCKITKVVNVDTEAKLAAAIEADETYIVLANDITVVNPLKMDKSYTLDFNGNTLYMNTTAVSYIFRSSNIVFCNGTLDISGVNIPTDAVKQGIFYTANGLAGHADGNGAHGNTFTFDNMLLTGEGYTAYSVIMLRNGSAEKPNVINFINGSEIALKNEISTSGGVFKVADSSYANTIYNIADSTIDCDNITRLFLYGTVNCTNSTINFVDSTGTSNAFRQGVFTFDNSKVTITGGDKGISPRHNDTVIKNGSVVTVQNTTGNDVIFEYDYDILVDATSTFTYSSVAGTAGGQVIVAN